MIKVDNRGSSRRGLVFEAPIYGNMGDLEVADQVAGVDWAVAQGIADPHGVAVSTWHSNASQIVPIFFTRLYLVLL